MLSLWMRFEIKFMATLTIKNLPDDLYAALGALASKNRRSLNSEAIVLLENSLTPVSQNRDEFLEKIRRNREDMARRGVYLTDEIIEEAKKQRRF